MTFRTRRSHVLEITVVLLVAIIGTCWLTYPLVFQMATHAVEARDSLLNAYIQAWATHALRSGTQLFDTNIFYPARNTLALSENLFGTLPIYAPVYLVSGNPILASNVVIFTSFVFCALTMYSLVRYVSGDRLASGVAATVFAFAPVRLSQLAHMQLLSMYWTPLIVLFLLRYWHETKLGDLFWLSATVVMQVLCSLYLGYLAITVGCCFLLGAVLANPQQFSVKKFAVLLLAAVCVGAILFPLVNHYRQLETTALSPAYNSEITISASASPVASYLDGAGRVYGRLFSRFQSVDLDWEKHLFLGVVPFLLAVLSLFYAYRRRREHGVARAFLEPTPGLYPRGLVFPALLLGSIATVLLSYVLSLGPVLRIHDRPTHVPLPFYWLQRWVPGMGTFRVPARFGLSLMLGLAILSGIGFLYLVENIERLRGTVSPALKVGLMSAVLIVIGLEYNASHADFSPVMTPSHLTEDYQWLRQRSSALPILEVPMAGADGNLDPALESAYVYASTFHWHPLLNGYSGHYPPALSETFALVKDMPADEPSRLISGLGVRFILLHTDRVSSEEVKRWLHAAEEGWLHIVATFPNTTIFELPPSTCRSHELKLDTTDPDLPREAIKGKFLPLGISLSAGANCWADATTGGSVGVEAEWQDQESGNRFRYEQSGPWPLYLRAREHRPVSYLVRTPSSAGLYRLSLTIGSQHFESSEIRVVGKTVPVARSR